MCDICIDCDYVDDGLILEYFNNFGQNLVFIYFEVCGEVGFDFQFFMVCDFMLNVFVLLGGFIGVNSGLVLVVQFEFELVGVMLYEIGYVVQCYIVCMLGQQKQNFMIQLVVIVLGVLVGVFKVGGDVVMVIMMGGIGLVVQCQLNFSCDVECEVDCIGLQIMCDGGFDLLGMVIFFGCLQMVLCNYSDVVLFYLMMYLLIIECIVDIQVCICDQCYKQCVDNLEFQLVCVCIQVLQNDSV